MSLEILSIIPDSLADVHGLQAGDKIISINEAMINDSLDLQYHGADEILQITYLNKDNKTKQIKINQNWERPLGIIPEDNDCRTCINDCIFCFVDQMKQNFRDTLYIKDDDYRLSFTFGNFITLTNLTDRDYQRIIKQKLSPLYISVHTTNPKLHKKMLRYKRDFNILKTLKIFADNHIEFHTQIVVVPGWNDGIELQKTLDDLTSKDINSLSIGIVPVGLTKFRKKLNEIKPVTITQTKKILALSEKYDNTYCSDEFYILADRPIPSEEFYNGYPQLENGIGMLRLFIENFTLNKTKFVKEISSLKKDLIFITGTLAYSFISNIVEELRAEVNRDMRVVAVNNKFLGDQVTVAGLLCGKDIIDQVKLANNEIAVLSSNIFNDDDLTIDNYAKSELKRHYNNIIVIDEEFADWEIL